MGYSPSLFWDSSLQDIFDLMESYKRSQKIKLEEYEADLKAKISLNFVLARQIGEYLGSLIDSKVKITPLEELFPALFKQENNKEMELELYKAKIKDFALQHNAKLKRKED